MKNALKSLARHALTSLGTLLVTYGVITSQEAGVFIEASTPVVVGLLSFIVGQAWSLINVKHLAKLKGLADRFSY